MWPENIRPLKLTQAMLCPESREQGAQQGRGQATMALAPTGCMEVRVRHQRLSYLKFNFILCRLSNLYFLVKQAKKTVKTYC
jgi:hypothetical protein